jgi:hypothetical protein
MSTWNVRVADADQYRITFAGVPISRGAGQSGYADGEFLSIEQVQESFKSVEGTDGTVVRSKTNSRLVNINVSLIETSTSNAYFSSMITLDEGGVIGARCGGCRGRATAACSGGGAPV